MGMMIVRHKVNQQASLGIEKSRLGLEEAGQKER
jgi:hypothetical protein